jgi:hypothetical protein
MLHLVRILHEKRSKSGWFSGTPSGSIANPKEYFRKQVWSPRKLKEKERHFAFVL